jgi:sarcosine oxidase/L-pipecolate oxidase
MVVSSDDSEYRDLSLKHDIALGARIEPCETPEALREHIPSDTHPSLQGFTGFLNRDGGWVESGRAVANLLGHVKTLGARVESGCKIVGLIRSEGKTTGVKCEDGRTFHADKVVLASGSWTASSFEADVNLGLEAKCLATGSVIHLLLLET